MLEELHNLANDFVSVDQFDGSLVGEAAVVDWQDVAASCRGEPITQLPTEIAVRALWNPEHDRILTVWTLHTILDKVARKTVVEDCIGEGVTKFIEVVGVVVGEVAIINVVVVDAAGGMVSVECLDNRLARKVFDEDDFVDGRAFAAEDVDSVGNWFVVREWEW